MNTVVDLLTDILTLIIIHAMLLECAVQSLVNSVHVHSPHVINSCGDVGFGVMFAGYSWCKQPEEYVLGLQFKHGYNIDSFVILT